MLARRFAICSLLLPWADSKPYDPSVFDTLPSHHITHQDRESEELLDLLQEIVDAPVQEDEDD